MVIIERIQKMISTIIERFANPPDKVAVLELSGIIGQMGGLRKSGLTASGLEGAIKKAFEMHGIKAVALLVNSPGGSPVQSERIYKHIRLLAAEKELPVYAFAEDVAASGGYWLLCAGDEIYASESSVVGSIGVVAAGFGLEDFIKRYDVKRRVYTQGDHKAMLDPFMPEEEADVERLKGVQKDIYTSFKGLVSERRENKLKKGKLKEIFSGAFFSGQQAVELGLVDEIGEIRDVLRDKFGENVELKKVSPQKKGLLSRLVGAEVGEGDFARSLLDIAEQRLHWGRFGL